MLHPEKKNQVKFSAKSHTITTVSSGTFFKTLSNCRCWQLPFERCILNVSMSSMKSEKSSSSGPSFERSIFLLKIFFDHLCLGYCGKLSPILSILQESWQSCPGAFEVSCEVLLLGTWFMFFPYCCVWAHLLLHQTDTKSAHTGAHILQTHAYTHTHTCMHAHTLTEGKSWSQHI